jgi:predicted membrane chloride channel (bestrophin family)
VVAVLLLVCEAWWTPFVAAVAGVAVTLGFRAGAAVQRRRETREAARHWAELRVERRPLDTERARKVVVVLITSGLVVPVSAAAVGVLG